MPGEISFKEEKINNGYVLHVYGELDIFTTKVFKKKIYELLEKTKEVLIIDCEHISYVDSTGLGVFVGSLKKAKQSNKEVVLTNLKGNIKKLFTITGLDRVFTINESI
mgnify:CR=1 FL=1